MIEGNRILSRKNVYNAITKRQDKPRTDILYIESNGSQYVDTGVMYSDDIRVVINCFLLESSSYPAAMFGTRTSDQRNSFNMWVYEDYLRDDYATSYSWKWNHKPFGRLLIDKHSCYTKVNHSSSNYSKKISFSPPGTIYLFGINQPEEYANDNCSMRLYNCKIYDGDVLIRDFHPAIDLDTNEVCLYDTIEKIFYKNLGSGSFAAGPNLQISEEYEKVEYIQANRSSLIKGPYINLGVKPLGSSTTVVDFQYVGYNMVVGDGDSIFGTRNSNNTAQYGLMKKNVSSTSWIWRFDYGSYQKSLSLVNYSNRNKISIYKNILRFENGLEMISTGTLQDADWPLYLFAMNSGGSITGCCTLRMFSFELHDSNTNLYLVPVKRKSDEIAGMYDTVSGTFYASTDPSCQFVAGPNVYDSISEVNDTVPLTNPDILANLDYVSLLTDLTFETSTLGRPICASNLATVLKYLNPVPYTPIEYIEGTGTQWMELNIVPNETTVMQIDFIAYDATGYVLIGFFEEDRNNGYRMFYSSAHDGIFMDIGEARVLGGKLLLNQRLHYEAGNLYVKDLNTDSIIVTSTAVDNFSTIHTIKLLKGRYIDGNRDIISKGRIYSVKIYNETLKVFDGIPVRYIDGRIGLYDRVSQQFFGNSGSGEFIAGPDI